MDLRVGGFLVTLAMHGLVIGAIAGTGNQGGCGEPAQAHFESGKVEMIEAALAFKKKEPKRQPQKKKQQLKKQQEAPKVSRDAEKKVEPPKADKKEPDYAKEWEKFRTDEDEEPEAARQEKGGDPTPEGGAFDGSDRGWAETNTGHPYLRELARQIDFDVPTLERGKGEAIACVRLRPNGTVADTKMWAKSGNTNIDRAAEEALRKISALREKEAVPVPDELQKKGITSKWTCFKLGM